MTLWLPPKGLNMLLRLRLRMGGRTDTHGNTLFMVLRRLWELKTICR